jgi:hypothetical protein
MHICSVWFYILVFDCNTTDPVTKKEEKKKKAAIYGARFSAHFGDVFLNFP